MPDAQNTSNDGPPVVAKIASRKPIWIALFGAFILWSLIAIPGENIDVSFLDHSGRWKGNQTIQEFGWPYVHATKLRVDPYLYSKLGTVEGGNPTGPNHERLESAIGYLNARETIPQLSGCLQVPATRLAKNYEGE